MFASYLLALPLLSSLALASPTPQVMKRHDGAGSQIRSVSNPNLCVTVQGGAASHGVRLGMTGCWPDWETFVDLQIWSVIGPQRGRIDLVEHTNLCIDGEGVQNGDEPKSEECNQDYSQTWDVEKLDNGYYRFKIDGQCLDVEKDSTPSYQKPYISDKDLQMWECHDASHPDAAQQYFELA
ncbi:uncharacterized protein I303_100373 [Kwoniella dejecticola CBS 10117]|uniref:Ricin B lectin domain-containing protein n=1 Tax=Kwoniella dejecticola CBS 10117 TaxID=1296121 RepID=A0A1A6AES1_9TREE|nr:uncharacterized protein I303_00373 [Kwoniella dejecticola CBS 10117]OBR88556.1 hypothetical protein I303_00373 [Kwoniella dejecticola CBS 10117]